MIELAPNIFYIPGENDSRFPYCACLYLKGTQLRILIDVGMGAKNLAPVKEMGIDLLILSHCHIDHRLTIRDLPEIPVWCHERETLYLKDRDYFFTAMGLKRSGLEIPGLLDLARGMFDIEIAHELVDGERIELGGITLEALHTPGHTPGHLSFVVPEYRLLFSGDVDLTPFGPFYGHDFADIDDFLESIEKLKKMKVGKVASGHAGPFNGSTAERFDAYGQVIHHRERLLLKQLNQPRSMEDLKDRNLFYKYYPEPPELIKWFEVVHIEKHLSRLHDLGKVSHQDGLWQRK
jgi:ribonuclease/clavin/mitogillin